MTLSFFVTGNPKGQPRAKHSGKVTYTPDTGVLLWKQRVKEHALVAWNGMPFVGPVRVSLMFHFQRPASHYRKSGGLKPGAPVKWHTQKPDRDNLDKAVLDALTELHLWRDDCAVCDGQLAKVWAASPGCHVTIESLEE
jgi:Holliday junction resolvase RusA-like endonuclease